MVNASNRIGPPKHTSSPGFQPDLAWETREGASVEISGGPLLLAVSPPIKVHLGQKQWLLLPSFSSLSWASSETLIFYCYKLWRIDIYRAKHWIQLATFACSFLNDLTV